MGKSFREQVQESLSDFSRMDVCFFAWLCAVRALPFLASRGNFDYWKQIKEGDQRQRHLFAVLHALDVTYGAVYADYADAAARAADNAAFIAGHAINLRSMLFDDLEIIKTNKGKFQNDTTSYGSVWVIFQSALYGLGCEYWGKWYDDVFAKGFMLDKTDIQEIERRLIVSKEIMELGVADVAMYVREMKKGVTRLNEARIILLGETGAGKTSLVKRLIDPYAPMPDEERDITEGVDITSFTLRDIYDDISSEQDANVYVWDFAGHSITHVAHRCFLSERCVYIILYDGRTEERNRRLLA